MSEGFNNPIVGGGGGLVYPSIHSPNFAAGPPITGWSIDKNGNASFSGTLGGVNFEINSSGAFFYSGTPALGNLIAWIASVGGTDRFGNAYSAVFNVGSQAGQHAGINSAGSIFVSDYTGNVRFEIRAGAAGSSSEFKWVWGATQNVQGQWNPDVGTVAVYQDLGTGAQGALVACITDKANVTDNNTGAVIAAAGITGKITGFQPGGTGQETWHTLTPVAGFAAGTPAPRYRFEPIGPAGQVRLAGRVTLTANQAGGTNFFTLPAGYRPATATNFLTENTLAGGVGISATTFAVLTSGALQIEQAGNNGQFFDLDGVTFPLD